jgi:DNA-binding XRE family transcriptional regulator
MDDMPNENIQNDLRIFRNKLNLTQEEVAFIVDTKARGTIAKHESGEYPPTIDNIICYELLFQAPLFELFAGRYTDVTSLFKERVNGLIFLLERREQDEVTKFKIEALKAAISDDSTTHAAL